MKFVETEFDPVEYNSTYFGDIMEDEAALIAWLVAVLPAVLRTADPSGVHLLDAGCGPTVHRMFAFEPYVGSFTLADFMPQNLTEVERWRRSHPGAHDWSHFSASICALEAPFNDRVSVLQFQRREARVRSKISGLGTIDLRRPLSLRPYEGGAVRREFDVVTSFFCADSATDDVGEFSEMLRHAAGYLAPGGWFVGSALGGCPSYRVGGHWFPSPRLEMADISSALELSDLIVQEIVRFDTPQMGLDGFDHIYAFVGRRP